MTRFLREPLVHFLVAGALLFVLHRLAAGPGGAAAPDRIVVTEARVASLAETFERTWLRPPRPEELAGLVEDYVEEEILYREALALGLDRDDLVVRRRMRQKMEFLSADLSEPPAPTDAELEAHLAAQAERFREPARLDFQQVFVASERRGGEEPEARARALLGRLREGSSDPASLGDPSLLPRSLSAASQREVAAGFGQSFAEALFALSGEGWQGPLRSGFGWHLVRVGSRTPGRLPPLAEIRDEVAREWSRERQEEADRRFVQALRQGYEIEVRLPDGASPAGAPQS